MSIETRRWEIYRYQGEWSNDEKHGKGTVSWFWSFVECQEEWIGGELQGIPTCSCRFVLLQRLVEVAWHYLIEHHLDLAAVLGVCIGLRLTYCITFFLNSRRCFIESWQM